MCFTIKNVGHVYYTASPNEFYGRLFNFDPKLYFLLEIFLLKDEETINSQQIYNVRFLAKKQICEMEVKSYSNLYFLENKI